MDQDGRHVFAPTPSVGVVYIWGGVYVILILRDKTLTRYQQSLTKLNVKANNIYVEVFLAQITCMALVGIQALSYKELIL